MPKDHIHEMQEIMLAKQVARIVSELRIVEVADYIAFIHLEHFGNIYDIVDAATELHFYPNTMRFGNSGRYELDWDKLPIITLDMEFSCEGVIAYFRLILSTDNFGVELDNIVFENPSDDETNTRHLMHALNEARIRPDKISA